MARSVLTVNACTNAGVALTDKYGAADALGSTILMDSDKRIIVFVSNADAAPINVTFATPGVFNGQAVDENVVSVTNAKTFVFGGFDRPTYEQTAGVMHIDYSAVTNVTVAVLKVAKPS
jgi:hypothetical protein